MEPIDLAPLQTVLAGMAAQGRTLLLPALQAAQGIYGYLPEPAAAEIAKGLHVPLADVHGVIEFYHMLYSRPVGSTILRVCTDPPCGLLGGEQTLQALCQSLGIAPHETTPDGAYTVERAPCLGLCDHAPAVMANDIPQQAAANASPEDLCQGRCQIGASLVAGDLRLLTGLSGASQATTLAEYIGARGYRGLNRALSLTPAEVIAEVKASGLVGRGGAAFPTGLKWESAANAPATPKYVVCNADESEPGTFKDRILLLEEPHRTIEGMVIAAYAIQAHTGYLYLRGEYSYLLPAIEHALGEARQANLLGHDILGCGFSFDIELRLGAGAYICGEETAQFESIEGMRGFPRLKPPFPTTHGLFGKPTDINNVETFSNVPEILAYGAAAYRQFGTEKSSGPKLFCLSGDVAHPGLYEVAFGTTLGSLLAMAGGVKDGRRLQAVLLGGAAGAFATPDQLDLPLTLEDLRQAGLPLGSGVVMVLDDTRDLRQALLQLGRFFAHESCGKCYPCQLGTQRQYEILQRLAAGTLLPGDSRRLEDVGWTMTDASICGLGQTAASAVLSAMKIWPELFADR